MIKKVLKIFNLYDRLTKKADLDYWLKKAPQERIQAVEILRRQHNGGATGIQRVVKVIQHS